MKSEMFEALLREIQEKHIGLDLAAKILWQLRIYIEYKTDEKYCSCKDSTELIDCRTKTEHARLQLEHYLVVAGIESISIDRL